MIYNSPEQVNWDIQDGVGRTAFHYLADFDNAGFIEHFNSLIPGSNNKDTPSYSKYFGLLSPNEIGKSDLLDNCITSLALKGASISIQDIRGINPLNLLVRNGRIDAFNKIITNTTKPPAVQKILNSKDNDGKTALHFFGILLQEGSSIRPGYKFLKNKMMGLFNTRGDTSEYFLTFLKKLISLGANPSIKNNQQQLPKDIVALLLENPSIPKGLHYNFLKDCLNTLSEKSMLLSVFTHTHIISLIFFSGCIAFTLWKILKINNLPYFSPLQHPYFIFTKKIKSEPTHFSKK